jgi:RNA exonuclease 1
MTTTKKYKLFSSENAEEGKATCAFFLSPAGCRNGDNCKFAHTTAATPSQTCTAIRVEMDDSSVSSESDDEVPAKPVTQKKVENKPTPQKQDNAQKKKKNKRKSMDDDDIFSAPKSASNGKGREQQTPSSNKKQKQSTPVPTNKTPKAKQATPKAKAEPKPQAAANNLNSFLSSLPVASFSIPGSTPGVPTAPKKEEVEAEPTKTPVKKEKPKKEKSQGVLPTSTAVGKKWLKSVVESRKHERYSGSLDFNRYKQIQAENGIQATWIKAKPYGSWCASHPQAIAIDCEMCETQDPLSGAKDSKALCRLSVVNAEKPEEVLIDTLVKPAWPVTDYRTRINGIKKEHLDNVEFTLRHAQAFMLKLCSQETVIVGHAVHNDLVSLNMEHDVVSDSSFLFRAKDSPGATPSLKDCVKTILKKDMPETHDSVNDARKALECVLEWVNNDGKVEEIERSAKPQSKGHQLFIHRIPNVCTEEHLTSMFLKHTTIEPIEVDEIEFAGSTGKTHVSFKTTRHANLAFESLDGNAEEEKSGRLQKKVYLRNGNYIRVRKMVHAKRPFNGKPSNGSKQALSSP